MREVSSSDTTSPPSPTPPPPLRFQKDTLANYACGDKDTETLLISTYLKGVKEGLPKAEEACKNNDGKDFSHYLHQIKGASSYVGAEIVYNTCVSIEEEYRKESFLEAGRLFQILRDEIKEVIKLLDEYLNT